MKTAFQNSFAMLPFARLAMRCLTAPNAKQNAPPYGSLKTNAGVLQIQAETLPRRGVGFLVPESAPINAKSRN